MELYLLNHYEDTLQLIPLLSIGLSLILLLVLLFNSSRLNIKLFKASLLITALSGLYGSYLHLESNYEFELEMKPTAGSWDLFVESLSGAIPALAPGSLIALALIGYSYTLLLNKK